MALLGYILLLLIDIFVFLLILRIVTEMIQGFSRSFQPPRWFALTIEPVFRVTDPPVMGLRKMIPPVRLGNLGLDVSILVLFFICIIAQNVIAVLLSSGAASL